MRGAFLSYGLGLNHKHIPETMRYGGLSRTPVFTPTVGAWAQGMTVTIPLHLRELGTTPDALYAALSVGVDTARVCGRLRIAWLRLTDDIPTVYENGRRPEGAKRLRCVASLAIPLTPRGGKPPGASSLRAPPNR